MPATDSECKKNESAAFFSLAQFRKKCFHTPNTPARRRETQISRTRKGELEKWSRSNRNGKFQVQVWNAANELTFEAEFESAVEADRTGEEENRKALSPLLGQYKMTDADWNDPLLDMTDDELLAALSA